MFEIYTTVISIKDILEYKIAKDEFVEKGFQFKGRKTIFFFLRIQVEFPL